MTTQSAARRHVLQCLLAIPVVASAAEAPGRVQLPRTVVHKTPTCGCCSLWVEHMQSAGFPVTVVDIDNLDAIKTRLGVPVGKGSCHTAEVDGYFVEGHVPAAQVQRLLRERPRAKGLTVPGMPLGSPGMEGPAGRSFAYEVLLVQMDGSTSRFAQVTG